MDGRGNVWYDHSSGRGGDIIEAVQVFENKSFSQSVQRLSCPAPERIITPKKKPKPILKIEIESVREISHLALVNYIRDRGLEPVKIISFAKEVHWRNKGKKYFAVGFPNEAGGWVLRSSIFKGNILGGGISIEVLGKPERIKVFEGWFDFLSYLKLSGTTNFKAIILNSTANLSIHLMLDILRESQAVDLYLDNDATGDECTSDFMKVAQLYRYCLENGLGTDCDLKALRGSRDKVGKLLTHLNISEHKAEKIWKIQKYVSDRRCHYVGFEDLNVFLIGRII